MNPEKNVFYYKVRIELDTIKKNATPEEINLLDMDNFLFTMPNSCIYGQMTGNCNSERANQIQGKQYRHISNLIYDEPDCFITYDDHCFLTVSTDTSYGYTALEKYLYMSTKEKHKEIIDYLKGNINEICITDQKL